jgi:RHS repeat-associated protein
MPASPHETVLCRYRYDPLDRLAGSEPSAQADIQRFYCKSRLATEIQGAVQTSIFQHDDQLLAQQQSQNARVDTTLLATDQQRSVLNALDATQPHPLAYSPYGHRPLGNGLLSLLGFNGERPDPVTGHYLLGNGYRAFNPVLMRFNSPDSWSPFGEGGLNAYAYCAGDPRNRVDPTGHLWLFKGVRSLWRNLFKSSKTANIYKHDATLSKKISAQKGLKLEKVEAEHTATKLQLEETRYAQKIERLKYEGIISSQADEIEKLKAINQKLMPETRRPQAPTNRRLGPPIPERPVATLASQKVGNDLWDKELEYLDLALTNKKTRNR